MSTLARTCFRTMHSDFPQKIVSWYTVNGRKDLPWRRGISGYRIWISEIMLQQTQVKTVIPYYQKFIKSFPSLSKLLQASEDEILSLWSGLGFYRRAKNIYKSCRIIETNFSGRFPRTFDDLIQLPGIGRSTAGAIMSIAYQQPFPILDANVKRVLSRYIALDQNLKQPEKILWQASEEMTAKENIFEYTQGIMDLGATVCTAAKPSCQQCPVEKGCGSAHMVLANKPKRRSTANPIRKLHFVLPMSDKGFLMQKKLEAEYWESLWVPLSKDLIGNIPVNASVDLHHKLSHLNLNIKIDITQAAPDEQLLSNQEYKWINKTDIAAYAMPTPIRKLLERYV